MEYINEEYQNAYPAVFLMLSGLSPLGSCDLLIGKQNWHIIWVQTPLGK